MKWLYTDTARYSKEEIKELLGFNKEEKYQEQEQGEKNVL